MRTTHWTIALAISGASMAALGYLVRPSVEQVIDEIYMINVQGMNADEWLSDDMFDNYVATGRFVNRTYIFSDEDTRDSEFAKTERWLLANGFQVDPWLSRLNAPGDEPKIWVLMVTLPRGTFSDLHRHMQQQSHGDLLVELSLLSHQGSTAKYNECHREISPVSTVKCNYRTP